jgi:hypothetical protein
MHQHKGTGRPRLCPKPTAPPPPSLHPVTPTPLRPPHRLLPSRGAHRRHSFLPDNTGKSCSVSKRHSKSCPKSIVTVAVVKLDLQADAVIAICTLHAPVAGRLTHLLSAHRTAEPLSERSLHREPLEADFVVVPFGREHLHADHLHRSPCGATSASMSFSRSSCASPAT